MNVMMIMMIMMKIARIPCVRSDGITNPHSEVFLAFCCKVNGIDASSSVKATNMISSSVRN